jgi:hypothetical protein
MSAFNIGLGFTRKMIITTQCTKFILKDWLELKLKPKFSVPGPKMGAGGPN